MAIDGAVIWEFVVLLNQLGVTPTEEVLFDIGTVGVMADGAFAGVALGISECGRSVAVGASGILGVDVEGFGDEFCGVWAWHDIGAMHRLALALGPGLVRAFRLGRVIRRWFGKGADDGNYVGGG